MQIANRISVLYHSLIMRFMSIPTRLRAIGSVTVAQMKLLLVLEFKKEATLGEVSGMLGVTQGAASELVDKLVRAGYVQRERSESDRRAVRLTLRHKGRRLSAQVSNQRLERVQKVLSVISSQDARRMVAALETVNEILAKRPKE